MVRDSYRKAEEAVPEPFIWYIAEQLASAGNTMHIGFEDDDNAEIVHRDIKPGNVFLAENDGAQYPAYPRPVLGDFGVAFKTRTGDPNNPRWFQREGTPNFMAPEQHRWCDFSNGYALVDQRRICDKTNVFGFGLVLWSMVMATAREAEPPIPLWLPKPAECTPYDWPPEIRSRRFATTGQGSGI